MLKRPTIGNVVFLAAIAALGLALLTPPTAQAQDERPTLAATRTAILVWLADEMALFADIPIELRLYASGTQTSRDLLASEVQMATSSEFAFVSQALEQADLRIVSTLSSSRTAKLIARRNDIGEGIGALHGRRVAVTRRSIGEYFLWQSLVLEGMSFDDVQILDMRPAEIVEALADGRIDAALTWEPYVYQARRRLGDAAHVFEKEAGHYYHFLLTGKAAWLRENHDLVVAVLNALLEAETFAQANPTEAKAMVAKRLAFDALFMDYLWPEHSLGIGLSQDLLRVMEYQSRWRIASGLTAPRDLPDVLEFVHADPLLDANPSAVQIIR